MEVTNEALEVIGRYVRGNLGTWIREAGVYPAAPPAIDPELRERTVRVEEELKAQREPMKIGFDRVDQRFGQVEKRFEEVHAHTTRWMVFLSTVMSLIGPVLAYGTFFR